MKNLSKLSLLVVFLSIFIFTPVFAATTPINKSIATKAILLASVNIKDAKIVSQKGNIFNISFSLSNGEGLQTGVKYGVKLVSESKTGQMIIDERVYDESLTLNPNMTTKKDIVYTAPASLSGSYTLMLTSNNSSSFPFGITSLGKVTLIATTKGIEIIPETCTLQIVGDKTGKTYNLIQGVGINNGESINLTCEAMNSSKIDVTTVPSYEVHSGTSFGDIITQSGGSAEPITFKIGEKKSFSVTLPKATIPQIYNVNFTLNDKDNKSNSIDVNYMVLGVSATIDNVSLDKDYYNKGDTALLSLIYTSNASSPISSKIQISNSKGKSCAEPQTQTLTQPIPLRIDTSIVITSSCIDPKITATLTDDKGVVLAEKEFNVKTTSAVPAQASNKIIIYVIIALLVIIILFIYFKKKKNLPSTQPTNNISMSIIFPFLLLVALFGFMPTNKVSADTYAYNAGYVSGKFVFDRDPSSYYTGSSIGVSTSFVFFAEDYGYGPNNRLTIQGSINGQTSSTVIRDTDIYVWGSYNGSFTAPSTAGSYNAVLAFAYYKDTYTGKQNGPKTLTSTTLYSNTFSFPYTVVAPPAPAVPLAVTVYAQNMTIAGSQKSPSALTVPNNTSVTISWESTGATSCTPPAEYITEAGTGPSGFFRVDNMTSTTNFTVECNDDSTSTPSTGSCTGTIPGSCGPANQEINCGNLRNDNTPYSCEALGCVWHGSGWSGDTGYCDNQNYMTCTDYPMQSEDTCNVVSCGWTPPVSGSCSSISDSTNCGATSGCTWK
ncbi:MAG: hypothetical protein WCW54_00780 [Candidatus Paceibacterota bacterium]